MVYLRKMVAVIRIGGRILREFDTQISGDQSEGSIILPFGSEYDILLKNLESRPARVKIWIDGEDVLSGNGIIVQPNSSVSLDGFMNTHGRVTNKFRFIQKTEQIINHRGDRIDDGFVKVEFRYEKPKPVKITTHEYHHHHHDYYHPKPYWPWIYYPTYTWTNTDAACSDIASSDASYNVSCSTLTSHHGGVVNTSQAIMGESSPEAILPLNAISPEEGITVKGSESAQHFRTGYIGELEPNAYSIIIRLKGTSQVAGEIVVTPVEVKTKIECQTCGTKVKSGNKYCPQCGTCVVEL